jgi:hypothetical protein
MVILHLSDRYDRQFVYHEFRVLFVRRGTTEAQCREGQFVYC